MFPVKWKVVFSQRSVLYWYVRVLYDREEPQQPSKSSCQFSVSVSVCVCEYNNNNNNNIILHTQEEVNTSPKRMVTCVVVGRCLV